MVDFVREQEMRKKKKKEESRGSYITYNPDPDDITLTPFDKNKEIKTKSKSSSHQTPDEEYEPKLSENISEISANDYGYFDYKIPDDASLDKPVPGLARKGAAVIESPIMDRKKSSLIDSPGGIERKKSSWLDIGGSPGKVRSSGNEEYRNRYNLVKHLAESYKDPSSGKQKRIATKLLDIITHTAKEENDYITFNIVNVEALQVKKNNEEQVK